MAIVEFTLKVRQNIVPGRDGYEDCTTVAEAIELDLEMLRNGSADPGEMLAFADEIEFSAREITDNQA